MTQKVYSISEWVKMCFYSQRHAVLAADLDGLVTAFENALMGYDLREIGESFLVFVRNNSNMPTPYEIIVILSIRSGQTND